MQEERTFYHELYDETFRKHVLSIFNEDIQRGYFVVAVVRMPDGKWLIKLERNIFVDAPPARGDR